MMQKDIRCVSVIFDRHVGVWRVPSATWFHAFFTDSTPSPTLNSGHQSRFGSAHLCVTPTWLRARHSDTDPPDCLKGHSFSSSLGRLVFCLGRSVSSGLLRLTQVRSSDYESVNTSMSSCHSILWDFQLLYLICFSFPVLCLSILLAPLVFRTRSVGFSTEPNGLLSTFRCYGHIVRFGSSIFPDIFFDVVYAWRLEYVERFPDLDLSIITKWAPRFVVFGIFGVVALSETDGFVMSTLVMCVGTGQMETSTRRISADLLCDDLSILSRSPGRLHRHRPLSRVSSPCRWATTLTRTESTRLHTSCIGGSLMRTGSGLSQMSLRNRKSSCVISDSLSFWFLSDIAVGWCTLWHYFKSVSTRSGVNSFTCSLQKWFMIITSDTIKAYRASLQTSGTCHACAPGGTMSDKTSALHSWRMQLWAQSQICSYK